MPKITINTAEPKYFKQKFLNLSINTIPEKLNISIENSEELTIHRRRKTMRKYQAYEWISV